MKQAQQIQTGGVMEVPIAQVKPNPQNPRLIKDHRFEKLVNSIQSFPDMANKRPLVCVTDTDGKYMVLGGNMRLKAMQQLKWKQVPVVLADEWTAEQRAEFVIKDNVGFGEHDWEVLANEWDSVKLEKWGLEIPNWEAQGQTTEDDYEQPDEVKTDIVAGDLFEIGQHRLLCGDSTNADDVAKLLQGKEPYLMVTDPPYGVNYDANWRNDADRANGKPYGARAIGKVSNDSKADWTEAWALAPSAVAYVWHADRHASEVQRSLEACKFEMRCQIVWVKNNIVISRGDYHWKHEPCWYAVKKGNKGNWAADRKQTTVWDIDKPLKSETGHSTQKPVECMARPIRNHDGDVYDPFIGSGTTMVASEQLGRKCYGMEIDPKYCHIIVERMLKLDPTLEVKRNGKEWKPTHETVDDAST